MTDRVSFRRQVINSRVIDVSIIPFMRSRKVFFRAQGLHPRTRYFPYLGGRAIDDFTRAESTFTRFGTTNVDNSNLFLNRTSHPDGSSNLTSDSSGQLIGSFIVPNTATNKFRTGTQEFKLLDISGGVDANAISTARTAYTASGIIQTIQDTVRTTRVIDRTITVRARPPAPTGGGQGDPLAQTFYVDQIDCPNGLFVTKVRIYFATKSTTIPVQCQIRQVENGVPIPIPLPDAVKFLGPSEVNIPSDLTDIDNIRSNGTDFVFEEPIYLSPGREYAIVLLAETTDYNVHVAKTYDFVIGSTEARVSRQPTLGSMFTSQNGSTWTPDQERDLMFQLYRAEFATSGTADFTNVADIRELLEPNAMLTDSGGTEVHVFMRGHGFSKNDKVFVSGVDDADVSGAFDFASSILGSRTITKVDHTGFAFAADSNADANLFVGGSNAVVTRNIMYDQFVPLVQTILPSVGTTISASAKKSTGASYAGIRNTSPAHAKASSYTGITLNEMNFNAEPHVILNDSNVGVHSGVSGASFDLRLELATDDTKVSPVIDLQRVAIQGQENIIDEQDVSATTNKNVPITFVAETDATGGSSAAKHITRKVVLEEPAVGIKILFAANRPAAANFRVFFKTGVADDDLNDFEYTEVLENSSNPADEIKTVFREYEYLAGGQVGNLDAFTQYQVKIVMESTNSSKIPVIRDLRAIALVT